MWKIIWKLRDAFQQHFFADECWQTTSYTPKFTILHSHLDYSADLQKPVGVTSVWSSCASRILQGTSILRKNRTKNHSETEEVNRYEEDDGEDDKILEYDEDSWTSRVQNVILMFYFSNFHCRSIVKWL